MFPCFTNRIPFHFSLLRRIKSRRSGRSRYVRTVNLINDPVITCLVCSCDYSELAIEFYASNQWSDIGAGNTVTGKWKLFFSGLRNDRSIIDRWKLTSCSRTFAENDLTSKFAREWTGDKLTESSIWQLQQYYYD